MGEGSLGGVWVVVAEPVVGQAVWVGARRHFAPLEALREVALHPQVIRNLLVLSCSIEHTCGVHNRLHNLHFAGQKLYMGIAAFLVRLCLRLIRQMPSGLMSCIDWGPLTASWHLTQRDAMQFCLINAALAVMSAHIKDGHVSQLMIHKFSNIQLSAYAVLLPE